MSPSVAAVEKRVSWLALAILVCALVATPNSASQAAEQDLNLWSVFFLSHWFDDHWSASFQTEVRADGDISRFDALVVKPGGYYRFNDVVKLGAGYKYQDKGQAPNEHDAWQELYLHHGHRELELTHQFRLEERFINGIDGVIPRLRYLLHVDHPINSSWYLAASEAVRFNLVDRGRGPVMGFEQNRLYFGVGYRTGIAKIEFGYLWRYERERVGPDASDHVLRFQFLFDTKGRHPKLAGS
jgi:hypothetical protein